MTALKSRVTRLERRLAPDANDPLGLRALTDDELSLFIRLLHAPTEGHGAARVQAELDAATAAKFELLLKRASEQGDAALGPLQRGR